MENSHNEAAKTFEKILSKRGYFWTFISLIFLIMTLIIAIFFIFSYLLENNADNIRISETGAIIIEMRKSKAATFLLSSNGGGSCTPWIDTGIHVTKGEKIFFKYSGKINTGIHTMVEAADKDIILPRIPWSSAEGLDMEICSPKRDIQYLERLRKKALLNPNLPQGRLIGTISSTSRPDHRPNVIIDIPKFTTDSYTICESGTLWLTINEAWLDSDFLMNNTVKSLGMSKKEFDFIKRNNYSNVWYDDNSGFFNVTIEIKK